MSPLFFKIGPRKAHIGSNGERLGFGSVSPEFKHQILAHPRVNFFEPQFIHLAKSLLLHQGPGRKREKKKAPATENLRSSR